MDLDKVSKIQRIIGALKERVKCTICLERIQNCSQLQCGHVFCKGCIDLYWTTTTSNLCPLCKKTFKKRQKPHENWFVNKLGCFVSDVSQILASKEQNEPSTTKNKNCAANTSTNNTEDKENAFNMLLSNTLKQKRRCYTNKRRNKAVDQSVLHFQDADTRHNIINWLNDANEKLDVFSQKSQSLQLEDFENQQLDALDLPRVRSQSLSINKKTFEEPLLKRYQSLSHYMDIDDYTIEDVNSEQFVQQAERKVIQGMLEEECLDNLENFMQQNDAHFLIEPKKLSKKYGDKKTTPTFSANSGWERVKNVKKSIKKASKVPKKLNISIQSEEKVESKRKSKRKRNISEENNVETKKFKKIELNLTLPNKENRSIDQVVDILEPEVSSTSKETKTFNLSAVEKYFVQNMPKISSDFDSPLRISKRKSKKEIFQDEDMETQMIDFIQAKPHTEQNKHQAKKQQESQKATEHVTDGILVAENLKTSYPNIFEINILTNDAIKRNTNKSTVVYNKESKAALLRRPEPVEIFHSKFDFVRKVCNKENSIDNILEQLNNTLAKCVERTLEIEDPIPNSLIDCFLNLKSFVNKAQEIRNCKEHMATQVCAQTCNVKVQTSTLQLSEKSLQTSQIIYAENVAVFVDKQVQTSHYVMNTEENTDNNKNIRGKESQVISLNNSKSQNLSSKIKISNISTPIANCNISSNNLISKITHLDTPVLNNILEEMNFNDNDNQNTRMDKTQDSVLILTAPKTSNKISRKLTFGDGNPTQKKFKRIKRHPVDDSDDENDAKKGSKQFIRDDLTIKFVDTQTEQMEVETEKTPENFDYDQYLDEVMQKYGNSPKNKAIEIINRKKVDAKIISLVHTSQTAEPSRAGYDKGFNQTITFDEQISTSRNKNIKTKLDDFEDHVFTADVAFQENLENFDKAIAECEKNENNTESSDIVENTPTDDIVPLKIKLASLNKNKISKCSDPPDMKVISKIKALNEEQVKRSTADEVQDMLKELRNDASFFNTEMESQMHQKCQSAVKESENKFKGHKNAKTLDLNSETFCDIVTAQNPSDINDLIDYKNIANKLPTFEEDDVFRDDLLEAELEKISFTAEQKVRNMINILQDIKVKSQIRGSKNVKNIIVKVEDSGEEDLVEKTPEKKSRSVDRALIANIRQLASPASLEFNDDHFEDIDLCLPPPPGFGDDVETTDAPEEAAKAKLVMPTQVALTDMIVTPETCMMDSPKNDQILNEKDNPLNISVNLTITPKVKNNSNHSTPRSQFSKIESLGFSPIKRNSQSQRKVQLTSTPLVTKFSTKKAPGLLTSAPNQKSILNYVTATQDSSQKPKPCLIYSRLMDKDMTCFTQLELKKLVTVASSWVPNVTHLVVLVDDRGRLISHTAKYLLALAHSAWVVRYEWVQDCAKQSRIVPEEPYEVLDLSGNPSPKISRLTRAENPLFKDYRLLCSSPFQLITKSDLEIVLRQFGAEIVTDIRDLRKNNKVGLVITDTTASEELSKFDELLKKYRVVTVDVEWVTKSIGQYNICSVRPYLLCTDENIHDLGYPKELVETVPYTLTEGTFEL